MSKRALGRRLVRRRLTLLAWLSCVGAVRVAVAQGVGNEPVEPAPPSEDKPEAETPPRTEGARQPEDAPRTEGARQPEDAPPGAPPSRDAPSGAAPEQPAGAPSTGPKAGAASTPSEADAVPSDATPAGSVPAATSPGGPPAVPAPPRDRRAATVEGQSAEPLSEGTPPPPVPSAPRSYGQQGKWYDDLEVSALVDAYYALNANFPKPQEGANRLRAFDDNNGFSLSWLGLGAHYNAGPVSATAELRVGPSADDLAGDDANHGLEFVKQAFVTYAPELPNGELWFDFGKFDAPFGVEVADSQENYNYTRGFLYTLGRPRFHTGLSANYRPIDPLVVKVLAVNGWNNTVDDNAGKSFGVQGSYASDGAFGTSVFEARLGYLVGPEQSDIGFVACPAGLAFDAVANACTPTGQDGTEFPVDRGSTNTKGLRHLIDAVVVARPIEALELALNGDYGLDQRGLDTVTERTFSSVSWFGAMLVGSYRFDEVWRVALRGEYYSDPDAFTCGAVCSDLSIDELELLSATGTIEARPVKNLALMLDARFDHAMIGVGPEGRFPASTGPGIFPVLRTYEPNQLTITLGAVAFTN